ncbi:hypothetical protein AB0N62_41715 [Streptomyces sp. NPDC093982]|uniref:hypothetical protein n=1 Tax=Streptomyces sp. NPDC093982 TaxID=3155077 RepID=UPI00342B1661
MAPAHGPCRARIASSDAKQMENITSQAESVLVVISVDPDISEPIPGTAAGPQLRQYALAESERDLAAAGRS